MSSSFWSHGLEPTRLLCPWDSPGKNTGVGCHALFQGIFPTQALNPRLFAFLQWQACSSSLHHLGSPSVNYPLGHSGTQLPSVKEGMNTVNTKIFLPHGLCALVYCLQFLDCLNYGAKISLSEKLFTIP